MNLNKKIQDYIFGGAIGKLDLSGEDMQYSNHLSGANLIGADLSCQDLQNADLSDANLWGANLSCADLSEAKLINCNLFEADLQGAMLIRANLSGANLKLANLSNANLEGADLSNATLKDAKFYKTNLDNAILDGSDIEPDEYSEPTCPHCNELYECEHMFARFDITFSELRGGYIFNRLDPLIDYTRKFFEKHTKKHGFQHDSFKTDNLALEYLWDRILDNYSDYNDFDEFKEICGYGDLIRFFLELIDPVDMGFIIIQYYSQSGMCCESAYKSVYSADPKKDFVKLKKYLKEQLKASTQY